MPEDLAIKHFLQKGNSIMFRVHLLSSECIEKAQKVNATQKRVENHRRMAAIDKDKYLEAEKEINMVKNLLVKEKYERQMAEWQAHKESLKKQKIVDALLANNPRYRRYSMDEIQMATRFFSVNKMIGEGAYGKVYICSLDHTSVAIKDLRPDESDRKEEFLREVWPSFSQLIFLYKFYKWTLAMSFCSPSSTNGLAHLDCLNGQLKPNCLANDKQDLV